MLRHIYLLPAMPSPVAFAISSISWHWNEFLWPLAVTLAERSRSLTVRLARFTRLGAIGARWRLLVAVTLLVAGLLFLAFLVFQRRFIQSFVHAGIR